MFKSLSASIARCLRIDEDLEADFSLRVALFTQLKTYARCCRALKSVARWNRTFNESRNCRYRHAVNQVALIQKNHARALIMVGVLHSNTHTHRERERNNSLSQTAAPVCRWTHVHWLISECKFAHSLLLLPPLASESIIYEHEDELTVVVIIQCDYELIRGKIQKFSPLSVASSNLSSRSFCFIKHRASINQTLRYLFRID